jgi:hypothetical protein
VGATHTPRGPRLPGALLTVVELTRRA